MKAVDFSHNNFLSHHVMSSSCGQIKFDLVECLKRSECMRVQQRSFHDCLRAPDTEIGDCGLLRKLHCECKKAQVTSRMMLCTCAAMAAAALWR